MAPSIDAGGTLQVRRHQPTRLEGFVDASFAFAVTLLVISVGHIPASVPEVLQAVRGLPAFGVSFLLLVRIWNAHRQWSRNYDIEDSTAVGLSLCLVFLVLAFVYPLRFLFSLLFAWLSNGYLVDQPIGVHSIEEFRLAFVIYGVAFAALSFVFVRLFGHALRLADAIGLSAAERVATRMHASLWRMQAGIALLSVAAAAALPFSDAHAWLYAVPGSLYALIGAAAPAIRRAYGRRIAALPA